MSSELKHGILIQNHFRGIAGRQHSKHVLHGDSHVADDWLAAEDVRAIAIAGTPSRAGAYSLVPISASRDCVALALGESHASRAALGVIGIPGLILTLEFESIEIELVVARWPVRHRYGGDRHPRVLKIA